MAQFSCVNGILIEDFDADGNLDIGLNTNDFGTIPSLGRYDALNGLVLKGDGKGNFTPLTIQQSGIFIPGNGRAFCILAAADNSPLLAASQNRGELKIFKMNNGSRLIMVPSKAVAAEIILTDNRKRKIEFPVGSSFLSQSSKAIVKTESIKQITWIDLSGKKWQ
jgi:hypothetical protein